MLGILRKLNDNKNDMIVSKDVLVASFQHARLLFFYTARATAFSNSRGEKLIFNTIL
jgi:hypothetical protein